MSRKKGNWWQYKNVFKNASHWFFYEAFFAFRLHRKKQNINLLQFATRFIIVSPLEVLSVSKTETDARAIVDENS